MTETLLPGDVPVSLDEARGWLRMGATIDDAVVAGLMRAATNICEAFVGQWLMVRAAEETLPIGAGTVRLGVRPVVGVDAVVLLADAMTSGGGEAVLAADDYRVMIARDGSARLTINHPGVARQIRVAYRAGMADDVNRIPEAIRQGIVRMTQHLYDARDKADAAPPAVIAALWQPWRRLSLGGGR
ncbi:head-tail connector protein [Sphingopyxis sp.]|uniref:head-tail connector protein n=1 Tax=Sphingopyxis sp. TaxID=1908224 RepID=UPI002FC943F3